MRRLTGLGMACLTLMLLGAQTASAATQSPSPGPSSSPVPSASPSPGASGGSSDQKLIEQARQRLNAGIADALLAQGQLSLVLGYNARQQDLVMQKMSASADRLAALDSELRKLQRDIDDTNHRIAIERAQLAALARTIYRQPNSVIVLFAQSKGAAEAMTSTSDLVAASRRGQAIEQKLKTDLAVLEVSRAQQRAVRDQEAKVRQSLADSLLKLSRLQDEGSTIRLKLDQAITDIKDELNAMHDQDPGLVESIQQTLVTKEAAATVAAQQELSRLVALWATIPATSSRSLIGSLGANARFTWPVQLLIVSQGFGPSSYAFEPAYGPYTHFHTGIDIAAPPGTPVLAAAAGVVAEVHAAPDGYGTYVVVRHDAHFSTLCAHLSLSLVRVGDTVGVGQAIGLVGSTGNSTGPHVHFEVRLDDAPVDPALYTG